MTKGDRQSRDDQLRASLERGLAQSAAGDVVDLGDFSRFATDEDVASSWDPMAGVLDDHDGNVEWPPTRDGHA